MEPQRSTEALKATIQAKWGVEGRGKKKKTAKRPPDGLILLFSVVLETQMWKMCKSKRNCFVTCSWGLLFLSAQWDGRLIMVF